MIERRQMREAFGDTLVALGAENEKVVVLDCDISLATKTCRFGDAYPQRFFNVGIAEQNMVGIAAGLATTGLIPFASTFGFLFASRALDQVRTSIAYPRLNVKLVGAYSGLSNPVDGPTHHSLCDLAIMRSIPNMTVIVPSDADQTELAVTAAAKHIGPIYLRLARAEADTIPDRPKDFSIGKATILRKFGSDVSILVAGLLVSKALQAAEMLRKDGIKATVLEVHTIKPIDEAAILQTARDTGAVVTVEEHSVIGGLGSAVAEILAETPCASLARVGIRDTFAESGSYDDLIRKYRLSATDIVAASRRVLQRGSADL